LYARFAGISSSRYWPVLGTSNNPIIDNKVDLPLALKSGKMLNIAVALFVVYGVTHDQ
jgi:hypothetical protein